MCSVMYTCFKVCLYADLTILRFSMLSSFVFPEFHVYLS